MKVRLRAGDEVVEATVLRRGDEIVVELADGARAVWRVRTAGDGHAVLEKDGRRWEMWGAAPHGPDGRQLWLRGRVLTYERERHHGIAGPAGDTSLTATIPAVVREILVRPGQRVTEGERLLLLESMKMVLPIAASRPGVVDAILCVEGEAVQPGVALVSFRPDEPDF